MYLEVHQDYKSKLIATGLKLKVQEVSNTLGIGYFPVIYRGWYLDFWVDWIKSAPIEIRYVNDPDLLFQLPVVFARLVIKDKKFLIGFDLWDKYGIYATDSTEGEKSEHLKELWAKCDVMFKSQYFNPKSQTRYTQQNGYTLKEQDNIELRNQAEVASKTENIFPMGLLLSHGYPFTTGKYMQLRNKDRSNAVASNMKPKNTNAIRSKMDELTSVKYERGAFEENYDYYLSKLGNSKVVIDYPSNSRVTFRTTESLALGGLLVGTPIETIYPLGFKLEELMAVCKPDLSDFMELVDKYVSDDKERLALTNRAMQEFDRVMAPRPLSKYWIDTILNYLK